MKILLLFLVIGSIAATPTNWILGEPGETCNSVCGKSNRVCNPDEQSKITSEDLIKKAMLNLGKSCNKVVHRDYPGTPFLGGQDCVYLTKGGNSVCDENKFAWHRALCYCEGTECGSEKAYHSGSMVKDYSIVTDAYQCLGKCNSDSSCKFWDFGDGWCRLRSDSGQGEETAYGYLFGEKNCNFEPLTKKRSESESEAGFEGCELTTLEKFAACLDEKLKKLFRLVGECFSDTDCTSTSKPVCYENQCVECKSHEHCASSSKNYCYYHKCFENACDQTPYPCLNGGRCIDTKSGYNCDCQGWWRGSNCETAYDGNYGPRRGFIYQ